MTVNFEKLPINGGKPEEISKVVNLLVDGKINSTGTFTLQQSSTTNSWFRSPSKYSHV